MAHNFCHDSNILLPAAHPQSETVGQGRGQHHALDTTRQKGQEPGLSLALVIMSGNTATI